MLFVFSKVEVQLLSKPFCFSIVLKFLCRRPSLDHIQGFINNRWGLKAIPIIGQLSNPCNVLVRMAKEEDFIFVMAKGNSKIFGVPFRVFH